MRIIVTLLFSLLTTALVSQMVVSKDGVELGDREIFISSCVEGANNKLMEIEGVQVDTEQYCSCVCDNLMPTINSWEMMEAYQNGTMVELFSRDENLKIVLECIEGYVEVDGDYKFKESENSELSKNIAIKACVTTMLDEQGDEELYTEAQAYEYCECALNKMFEKGMTFSDVLDAEDENSKSFNEVVMPCVTEILGEQNEVQSSNEYVKSDIQGGGKSSTVELVDYISGGYKLKISIGGVSKYYLFDTGASDLIINQEVAKELAEVGVLNRNSFVGTVYYEMANNELVEGQEVIVDDVVIGDYTLNNVSISVLEEGSLLCGTSFLDKFKKWEIDTQKKELILYK